MTSYPCEYAEPILRSIPIETLLDLITTETMTTILSNEKRNIQLLNLLFGLFIHHEENTIKDKFIQKIYIALNTTNYRIAITNLFSQCTYAQRLTINLMTHLTPEHLKYYIEQLKKDGQHLPTTQMIASALQNMPFEGYEKRFEIFLDLLEGNELVHVLYQKDLITKLAEKYPRSLLKRFIEKINNTDVDPELLSKMLIHRDSSGYRAEYHLIKLLPGETLRALMAKTTMVRLNLTEILESVKERTCTLQTLLMYQDDETIISILEMLPQNGEDLLKGANSTYMQGRVSYHNLIAGFLSRHPEQIKAKGLEYVISSNRQWFTQLAMKYKQPIPPVILELLIEGILDDCHHILSYMSRLKKFIHPSLDTLDFLSSLYGSKILEIKRSLLQQIDNNKSIDEINAILNDQADTPSLEQLYRRAKKIRNADLQNIDKKEIEKLIRIEYYIKVFTPYSKATANPALQWVESATQDTGGCPDIQSKLASGDMAVKIWTNEKAFEMLFDQLSSEDYSHRPPLRDKSRTGPMKFFHMEGVIREVRKPSDQSPPKKQSRTKKTSATLLSPNLCTPVFNGNTNNANLIGLLIDTTAENCDIKAMMTATTITFNRQWVDNEDQVRKYQEFIERYNYTDLTEFKNAIKNNSVAVNEILIHLTREAIKGLIIARQTPTALEIAEGYAQQLEIILGRKIPIYFYDSTSRVFNQLKRPEPTFDHDDDNDAAAAPAMGI